MTMSCLMASANAICKQYSINAYIVLLRDVLDEGNDLERGSRVKTGSRLVQEEQFRAGDELSSHTDTTLLTTGNTLPDRSTNQVVCLTLETKSCEEGLDTLDALKLADTAGQRQTSSKVQSLTNSKRTDQRVLLFNVSTDAAEGLRICGRAVDVDVGLDVCGEC